ncbi:glycosyltransferase [Mesorhizobium sp. M2D.F.Ca.ET.223.01.1.1]|uniref:glycosyltransferase n=1 Tax=Mesorhizobium sp. M2D.F.Ca.ET.223.01.1.1 TaxID=2563940 RepID=UPI001092A401|nr:glycosyltransferase [Mesorhizobium sp. M2D.F.Ca.ET.223.01.1.1]TGR83304.1 glycosyltransferase [Mesorhizobium sp. M2D.F.Ca.ET.223.01.1.1]TGT68991.1 glycosyltransferase [bacterium M00.F.Ca.ET.159.01.1.1]TGT80853.1 glycosyltransferase [bacterium M00.F.Ca.ET.157.01.1.1]
MKFGDCGYDLSVKRIEKGRSEPKVTVILPTFARADGLLQLSIESVLSQSYGDFELIVVDDGSRDGTADVLNEYHSADTRVVIHSYKYNSGLPALRVNQAGLHGRGKYIAYQFDDDLWTEDSLKVRMAWLERQSVPSVVYGSCDAYRATEEGEVFQRVLGQEFNYALLLQGNYIANNSVIHHAALFEKHGMYDPHVVARRYSDYDLWLRFGRTAQFQWIDATCSVVRANMENSLGRDIRADFTRTSKYLQIDRDRKLSPGNIAHYDLVSAESWRNRFSDREIREYYREEALPFISKFNDYCTPTEMAVAASGGMQHRRILVSKPDYSTSVDVTIRNFERLEGQRGFTSTFVRERDIPSFDTSDTDIAILYRTVGLAEKLVTGTERAGVSCAYLMDDNMLRFHEVGPEHSSIAPGTQAYRSIVAQITASDAVIGYSDQIIDDFKMYNPHAIRLNTNIQRRYIATRLYKRSGKIRIAIFSNKFRAPVIAKIWPGFQRIASKYRDNVEFHFWGVDPGDFPALKCDVHFRPFTHSYERYLDELSSTYFDLSLTPLEGETRADQSKSPIKLLESVAAGAISVMSDVPPYSGLPDTVCVKVPNRPEDWADAIEGLLTLKAEQRDEILERARAFAEATYTAEVQYYDLYGALAATEIHARLKNKAILYAFHEAALGGATLHLLRHAALAESFGFRVVGLVRSDGKFGPEFARRWREAVKNAPLLEEDWPHGADSIDESKARSLHATDIEVAQRIGERLGDLNVGLVHFATWQPSMTALGSVLGVPVVASVHQYYEGAYTRAFAHAIHCSSSTHGEQWKKASGVPVRRIVCPVDSVFFSLFEDREARNFAMRGPLQIIVSGTLQPRKNQLAAIEAALLLRKAGHDVTVHVIGYDDLRPDYAKACRDYVVEQGLEDHVIFHGFVSDPERFYASCDLLLISSLDESMPQTMLQAMASGLAVVSPNVGGVSELIRHRYSGLIAKNTSPEELAQSIQEFLGYSTIRRAEMLRSAYRTISILGRSSYVRAELMDLYAGAFKRWAPAQSTGGIADISRVRPDMLRERLEPGVASTIARLHSEVEAQHFSRPLRLARAVTWRSSEVWGAISSVFTPLELFSRRHFGRGRRDELRLSENLSDLSYREYTVHFACPSLRAIHLGVVPLAPASAGFIGIEIVSSKDKILGSTTRSLSGIEVDLPVRFSLNTPVTDLQAGWRLRVFVREADVPVTIYEVVRPTVLRGAPKRFPFTKFE